MVVLVEWCLIVSSIGIGNVAQSLDEAEIRTIMKHIDNWDNNIWIDPLRCMSARQDLSTKRA